MSDRDARERLARLRAVVAAADRLLRSPDELLVELRETGELAELEALAGAMLALQAGDEEE